MISEKKQSDGEGWEKMAPAAGSSRKFNKNSSKGPGPDIEKQQNYKIQQGNEREELLYLAQNREERAQGHHVK